MRAGPYPDAIVIPLIYGKLAMRLKTYNEMTVMKMIPPQKARAEIIQKTFRPARAVIGLLHTGQYLLIVS